MIEFRKTDNPKDDREYQLLINDILLNTVYVRGIPDEQGKINFNISTRNIEASRQIAAHSLENFLPIEFLSLEYYLNDLKDISDSVEVFISEANMWDKPSRKLIYLGTYTCSLNISPNLSEWKEEYTFADYAIGIFRAFSEFDKSIEVSLKDADGNNLHKKFVLDDDEVFREKVNVEIDQIEKRYIKDIDITFPYSSPQIVIEDELKRFAGIFQPLHKEVIDILTSKTRSKSITKYFDFPSEVSVPCEQYLLYFIQFLRDLGVEASSDLKHEAGRLLFTVTPMNAEEALDNIHEALAIYLSLPANPISDPSTEDDIEVQSLAANIDHLKGQLRLSQAVNRANEATLRMQQFHIQQMQRLLNGEVLLDSMKDVTPRADKEDTEKLMGGILTLGQLEKGGMKISLAKIYRLLKQRMGKGRNLPPDDNQS